MKKQVLKLKLVGGTEISGEVDWVEINWGDLDIGWSDSDTEFDRHFTDREYEELTVTPEEV